MPILKRGLIGHEWYNHYTSKGMTDTEIKELNRIKLIKERKNKLEKINKSNEKND